MKKNINEQWKQVPGYSDYSVSDQGRVRSRRTSNEKILKMKTNYHGYYEVTLISDEGQKKTFRVHRLVAEAFIPNPEMKPSVDHINNFKKDNRVCNLRWATMKEQLENPHTVRKRREAARKASLKKRFKVYIYDEKLNLLQTYNSTADAGRDGHSQGNVTCACTGVLKRYKGWIWSYTKLTSMKQREALEQSVEDKRKKRSDSINAASKRYVARTNYYQQNREKLIAKSKLNYRRKRYGTDLLPKEQREDKGKEQGKV